MLVDVLDHHHLELPRQEDHREHREHRQREPLLVGEALALTEAEQALDIGKRERPCEQIAWTTEHSPRHEYADGHEGQQLDDRLECDRGNHALVAFGRVQVPSAEHDREAGQQQRNVQRAVAPPVANRWNTLTERGGQQRVSGGDGFQLQCDVRHDADHGDQGHQPGQQRALAVAAGNEVGNRGDAVGLGDADHLAQHHPRQHHRQGGAEVDRQKPDTTRRSAAHAAEVGPGGAVHRHRQRVDPGVVDDRASLLCAPVADPRHREQQQQVRERRDDDQRGREHR